MQPFVYGASVFIFLGAAYEGWRPVLSLAVSSSHCSLYSVADLAIGGSKLKEITGDIFK